MNNRQTIRISAGDEPLAINFSAWIQSAKEVENNKGEPERLHFVNDDSAVIYLPEEAHQQLITLAPKGGTVEVSKRWIGKGETAYSFALPEQAKPAQRKPRPPKQTRVEGVQDYKTPAIAGANALKPAVQPQAQAQERVTLRYEMPPSVTLLAGCLVAAAKAANIAMQETGIALNDQRTIQALASTLFIHEARRQ